MATKDQAHVLGFKLLEKNKTVKERASSYFASIKRDVQKDVIDTLITKKEKMEDELFDLSDFTLGTNLNAGEKRMTKEECEERFKKIIEIEFQLKLINVELKSKEESFKKYFE